jgi:hypothetical protein
MRKTTIMKQRSKLSTLVALATAVDVNFSLFDALDDAEAEAKPQPRKPSEETRPPVRNVTAAYAVVR